MRPTAPGLYADGDQPTSVYELDDEGVWWTANREVWVGNDELGWGSRGQFSLPDTLVRLVPETAAPVVEVDITPLELRVYSAPGGRIVLTDPASGQQQIHQFAERGFVTWQTTVVADSQPDDAAVMERAAGLLEAHGFGASAVLIRKIAQRFDDEQLGFVIEGPAANG